MLSEKIEMINMMIIEKEDLIKQIEFTSDYEKVKKILEENIIENQFLRGNNNELNQRMENVVTLEGKYSSLENIVKDLSNKVDLLLKENEKLNFIIVKNKSEFGIIKRKLLEKDEQILILLAKNENLQNIIGKKSHESARFQLKILNINDK